MQFRVVEAAAQTMVTLQIPQKINFIRVIQHKFPCAINQSLSACLYNTLEKQFMASRQLIPSHTGLGNSLLRGIWKYISWNSCWNIISPVRWRYICFYMMTVSMPFHNFGDVASVVCLWWCEWRQASCGVIRDYWITEIKMAGPVLAATAVHRLCRAVTVCSLGHHWLKFRT